MPVYSWNSELPSGHNPFWIRDDALSGLGLRSGEPVSVDTRRAPEDGDLVVAEVELDGDSQRVARRYYQAGDRVRLEPVGEGFGALDLPVESVIIMGVITARVRFSGHEVPVEEPIPWVESGR